MHKNTRINSLDALRGFAVVFIIFFHTSIYNFANIHKLDFSSPPLVIIAISFMALWGGIFSMYSMVVNTYMFALRIKGKDNYRAYIHLLLVGLLLLMAHYILIIFVGRWNIDFVNNQPNMTFVASFLRTNSTALPDSIEMFEGSSLSTIALNMVLVSSLLYFLTKNNGIEKKNRNYSIFASLGFLIALLSFVRVELFSLYTASITSNNYLSAVLYGFVLSNPYPLLPYLAYGCFGALIGLVIFDKRNDLLKKFVFPTGLLFMVFGFVGIMNFEKTISKPDYFWYFKTNFELGLFLVLISGVYLIFENKDALLGRLTVIKWFSRISLTIYLAETILSEVLRIIVSPLLPQWNQTINGSLLFGVFNIIVWFIIICFWSRSGFKYSLEYFWVKLFEKTGFKSTKMTFEK